MEKDKIDIILHSVGFPKMYRNHFAAEQGSEDYRLCEELTASGLMGRGSSTPTGMTFFHVTKSGVVAAGIGEAQIPSDFRFFPQ